MVQKTQQDIFNNKFHLQGDVFNVQYNLFKEELIRQNYGDVFCKVFDIELIDGEKTIDSIVTKMKKDFVCNIVISKNDSDFCLSGVSTVIYLMRKHHYNSDYNDEPSPPQVTSLSIEEKGEKFYFEISSRNKNIYNEVENKLKEYGFRIINAFFYSSGSPVTFAFLNKDGIFYSTHSFDKVELSSIEQNYSENVIIKTRKLLNQLELKQNGVIILHGMQGTGKTFLLRSIITEIKKRRAIICSPPMSFLNDAGKIDEVVSNFRESLLVFEDIGDLLTMDSSSVYVDARANILNISEGLMSLIANCIILVTFNTNIEKIDPAIIRPGRCLANIEINPLSYEHSKKLVGDIILPKREYTLAEIYQIKNGEDPNNMKEVKGKMGF